VSGLSAEILRPGGVKKGGFVRSLSSFCLAGDVMP